MNTEIIIKIENALTEIDRESIDQSKIGKSNDDIQEQILAKISEYYPLFAIYSVDDFLEKSYSDRTKQLKLGLDFLICRTNIHRLVDKCYFNNAYGKSFSKHIDKISFWLKKMMKTEKLIKELK